MEMIELGGGREFDMIRSFIARDAKLHPLVTVGPGDDCTVIGDLAISVDASVENVHFRRDWLSAEEIGWRATAAALSDLAAVAAEPVAVLISTALHELDAGDFVQAIMKGARSAAESVGASIVGGDLTASTVLTIDVVAIGKADKPALRANAQAGDELWVTGRLGGSAAAVAALTGSTAPNPAARARYAHPTPRTREALWLRDRVELHAMIDLSDGLYGDLQHIAAASACAIEIDPAAVPVDHDAGATFQHAVGGGEDYEVAFTVPSGQIEDVIEQFESEFGVALTRIGTVATGSGVFERTANGGLKTISPGGFQHFGSSSR